MLWLGHRRRIGISDRCRAEAPSRSSPSSWCSIRRRPAQTGLPSTVSARGPPTPGEQPVGRQVSADSAIDLRRYDGKRPEGGGDARASGVTRGHVLAEEIKGVAVVGDLECPVGSLDGTGRAGQPSHRWRRARQHRWPELCARPRAGTCAWRRIRAERVHGGVGVLRRESGRRRHYEPIDGRQPGCSRVGTALGGNLVPHPIGHVVEQVLAIRFSSAGSRRKVSEVLVHGPACVSHLGCAVGTA